MAINYLSGRNWGTAGDWSTSSEPVNSGDVGLTESLPGPVTGGLVNTDVYLNSLQVTPACIHPIGTPTSLLTMSTLILIMEGQAAFNFKAQKAAAGGNDVVDCRINCASPSVKVLLDSGGTDPAEWDQIIHNRGILTLGAGMLYGTCRLEVGGASPGDATVDIVASGGGDTLPTIVQTSGKITSRVIVTSADIFGGLYEQFDAAVTTVNVGSGGMFVYKNATASTITTLRILPGGVADFTQGFGETTITTCWLHPGGTLIGTDQTGTTPLKGTLIFTTPIHNLGGMIRRTRAA